MPDAETLDLLRKRFCEMAAEVDSSGQYEDAHDSKELLKSQQADGSWGDIEYAPGALKDWDASRHLMRLLHLARDWYQTDGKAHGQLEAILRGLRYWYACKLTNPNWWHNQIGAPTMLGDTLLCIKPACPRELIDAAVPAFEAHHPVLRFTGQNLVWVAAIQVRHGILTDNPALASQGYLLAGRELRIVDPEEEGLKSDMSFHQHGKLLYSGGYGQGFAVDMARLVRAGAGTPYAMTPHKTELLIRMVLDGSRWMVRGHTFDYSGIGREISRHSHSADRLLQAAQLLAKLEHPRQAELAELGTAAGGSYVEGNRCFWQSDLMVQHRKAYAISVRVPSSRILNADMACCGGEGRLCHHMAEGATFLYRDGDEYRDIFAVWNWHQIPGATIEQLADFDPESLRVYGISDFAGGATDGHVGCMGATVARGALQVRKGFFLFDDVMVALSAGITCSSGVPVRTTLNQCNWRGPVVMDGAEVAGGEYPLAAGSRFWHDGIAYRVLEGNGKLRLGNQQGAWSYCGVGSSEVQALPVFNAGLDHGSAPNGASCAYLVQPGVAADAPEPSIEVLRNDASVQAVWHDEAERGHAIFYEAGEVAFPDGQSLTAEGPCFVLYVPQKASTAKLVLAQPSAAADAVSLVLRGRLTARLNLPVPTQEYRGASIATTICL